MEYLYKISFKFKVGGYAVLTQKHQAVVLLISES